MKNMQVYDGFYGDMTKFDPEIYRAKTNKEKMDDCWISPDGKWYNIGLGLHQSFAYRIFYMINPPKPDGELHHMTEYEDKATKIIIDKGWMMIERDIGYGITFRGYQNMTRAQYNTLLVYFGDTKLFRGWTIRGLWLLKKKEAKEQAKEDY